MTMVQNKIEYNHILVRLDGAMTQEHAHQYESVLIRLKSKELQR